MKPVAILLLVASCVYGAPLPQLAGEGGACSSILSATDNGVGYGVENAEDNTAGLIKNAGGFVPAAPAAPVGPPRMRRQLAGEGDACDSILSSTDNGVGYGVENAEDNTAGLISSIPKPAKERRQLDKIADGAGAIGDAAGIGATTEPVVGLLDTIDGQSTSDAATLGAQIGDDEATTLETIGKDVP